MHHTLYMYSTCIHTMYMDAHVYIYSLHVLVLLDILATVPGSTS